MNKIPELDIVATEPDRLEARAWEGTDMMVLQLSGVAETPDRPQLSLLLKKTHSEAMLRKVQAVVVEINRLTFMNSNCFKDFVAWISLVQDLELPYKVRFKTNPAIRWQKGSLHTLVSFGRDIVSFE